MLTESPKHRDAAAPDKLDNMLLFGSAAAGIVIVDAKGHLTAITSDAERHLHATPGSVTSLKQLPDAFRQIAEEVLSSGTPVIKRQVVISPESPTPGSILISATRSVVGKVSSVVMTVESGSSASDTELHLRRLDRLASVGTLSASMAHEIKNALVAVRTFTELLLEKHPDAELAGIVRREVGRVDTIAGQMLQFAAPAQPRFSSLGLHRLLEHCVRLVQHSHRNRKITFQTRLDARPDALTGDDHQLEQAFVNLLFNAVESIETEGALSICTRVVPGNSESDALREGLESPSQWIEIKIADTGVGIPAEKLEDIFDPFYTTKQSGTGLGLAVTRRIVQEHHGVIRVESQLGTGTTFTILLPSVLPG